MNVLLTGAFGGVGAFIRDAVAAAGHTVRCFDLPTRANQRVRLPHGVEPVWGDLRDAAAVSAAMQGIDVVLHVAFIVFPHSEVDPARAAEVNIGGTKNLLDAAAAQPTPPRFVFCGSYHVHPFVADRTPPLRVDSPMEPRDTYAAHKIEAEALIRASGLRWSILRLSSVMLDRKLNAHNLSIMFGIPLDTRVEMCDPRDVGLAFSNAVTTEAIDGKTLFIGGGPACQTTYRAMYVRIFESVGLPNLPEHAFPRAPAFIGDWLDTTEAQELLQFQRYTLDDYIEGMRARGVLRAITRIVGPLVNRWMVHQSPHHIGGSLSANADLITSLVPDLAIRTRLARSGSTEIVDEPPGQLPNFVEMIDSAQPDFEGPLTLREGALPDGLDVTYWAGGWFRTPHRRIAHLLDAYSAAVSLRVTSDGGTAKARRVPDPLYDAEQAKGRLLRKGLFSTTERGKLSPVMGRKAAHEAVLWEDRVYLTSLGGWFAYDPRSLDETPDNVNPQRMASTESCNLHPMVDVHTGSLLTYRLNVGPTFTQTMEFTELGADGSRRRTTYELGRFIAPHAYSFTDRYHVVPAVSAKYHHLGFLLGTRRGILEDTRDDGLGQLEIHLVPRAPGEDPCVVRFRQPGFVYHVTNSFEDAGHVVVDAYVTALNPEREASQFELDLDRPVWANIGGVFRFTIDPASGKATKRLLIPGLQRITFDAVDDRRRGHAYTHAWFTANDQNESQSSSVIHFDGETLHRHTHGEGVYLRQPRFVARHDGADEGDGWLVVPAWTPEETRVLLYDARRVSAGPIAVLGAGAILPYTNHGWAARTPTKAARKSA